MITLISKKLLISMMRDEISILSAFKDSIMTIVIKQLMAFVTSYFHDLTLKAGLHPIILAPVEFDDM